jgi:hypothetical protein
MAKSNKRVGEKPSAEHLAFSESVKQIIGTVLEKYGYSLHKNETKNQHTSIVYLKPGYFIKIDASTDYRDAPGYYNISLGAGNGAIDYTQWFAVALWWLKKEIEPNADAREYGFPKEADLFSNLSYAKEELLKYGKTILDGDLTLFNQIVKQKNQ